MSDANPLWGTPRIHDPVIIAKAGGRRHMLKADVGYDTASRTHLALEKDAPRPLPVTPPTARRVVAIPGVLYLSATSSPPVTNAAIHHR